jgi:hypothetical protein
MNWVRLCGKRHRDGGRDGPPSRAKKFIRKPWGRLASLVAVLYCVSYARVEAFMPKSHGVARFWAGLLACSLLAAGGCKTSDDATAAATQMSATAKALSDYYAGLDVILEDTVQIQQLNSQLYAKPFSADNKKQLETTETELQTRIALATDFCSLAEDFAKLTGSTAPADVAASAGKLESEVESLSSVQASSTEQTAMKTALQLLVTAVQERKEREAARAMDDFAKGLSALFDKEAPVWASRQQVYADLAGALAGDLVDQGATDNSGLLKVALDPFGLTVAAPTGDLKSQLAQVAKQEIATKKDALNDCYSKATDAMSKSLAEMSKRIDLVAQDKPMSFRVPPLTLANVEAWATKLSSN